MTSQNLENCCPASTYSSASNLGCVVDMCLKWTGGTKNPLLVLLLVEAADVTTCGTTILALFTKLRICGISLRKLIALVIICTAQVF